MKKKKFSKKINFNKKWSERDWEQYFQEHDAYRLSLRNREIRKKPLSRIKFESGDEVDAFDPILRAYGFEPTPSVLHQIKSLPFKEDENPDDEYFPLAEENPHYWGEGAPLASLPIYRDCCRFAIFTTAEIQKFLKRKDAAYKKKTSSEFENLRFHAIWIAINIAEGHQTGYAKDRLLGNIVKSKRAVRHAEQCMALLNRISKRTKSVRLRSELFSYAVQLRNVLFMWVDELRER